MQWQPGADLPVLRQRAQLVARIRHFFAQRGVLEVETPLLCSTGITDPSIEPLIADSSAAHGAARYLQTSP